MKLSLRLFNNLSTIRKLLFSAAIFLTVVIIVFLIYFLRSPVLIVSDYSFIMLYGQGRINSHTRSASFSLFRRVLTVTVSDEAEPDIIPHSIARVSRNPHCVIFPLRFIEAANFYRGLYPEVPAVILKGRYASQANISTDDFFVYRTDVREDFYFAGKAAGILDDGSERTIALFIEESNLEEARDAFLQALNESEKTPKTSFFTSFSEDISLQDLFCVIISGTGYEILERSGEIPLIFFTWIDPYLLQDEALLVMDDSPYAKITRVVKMMESGQREGVISSLRLLLPGKGIDREILQKIKKII